VSPAPPVAPAVPFTPATAWLKQSLATRQRDAARRAGQPRFFFFAATLLPLALTLLFDPSDTRQRLERTLKTHPEVAAELERAGSLDAALELLPERRIEGALLPRNSMTHWLYALAAALLFFSLILLLFDPGNALLPHWLGAGLLTSTIGIFLLVSLQTAAALGEEILPGGMSGAWYQFVRLIGFSYRAALDPDNGFVASLLGFTFGVGLCEEFTKALPLLLRLRSARPLDWRAACVWGLASGVGFGVAEGVMYAGDFYNGIAGADVYVVRFVSCVALHAIWAAAMGIMLARLRQRFAQQPDWTAWAVGLAMVFAIPVVLHGLYDTLLKRELNGAALVVAALSFAWLAWLTQQCVAEERRAHQALVRGWA
jgi:RsiW-degrading membrane proteinase PrsW (M82 family)